MTFLMLQVKAAASYTPPLQVNPAEQLFKSMSCVTHGNNLQRAPMLKPSKLQVKAPHSAQNRHNNSSSVNNGNTTAS